jgi:hypothetical protein
MKGNVDLNEPKWERMKKQRVPIYKNTPDHVKFEIAREAHIPLKARDNGHLTSRQAGKIGGPIGGSMVKEMIEMAKEQLTKRE